MWSYYGRNSKIVQHYPDPKFDTIVEPFAGTACYSLHGDNWKRNVILRDVNPQIVRLWVWLRDHATPELIRCLPDVPPKTKIPELPREAQMLTAFWSNQGAVSPHKTAGSNNGVARGWATARSRIAESLHKIRHWDIAIGDYASIPNIKATWFIDPPYQKGGELYRYCESIDFEGLADWCQSRRGQVIVCEANGADWLPFKTLVDAAGQRKKQRELIWVGGCK